MASSRRCRRPIHSLRLGDLNFHEQIGEGGFSTVSRVTFKKKHLGINEAAAKNVLNFRKDEVLILGRANHKNIVKLIGFIEEGPIHLILLEYTPLGSLKDYLCKDKSKPLSKRLQKKWAIEAGLAVQYLHQINILHRDIKSSNCLIFPADLLKLSDFGIAREIKGTHTTSSEKGTWRYMAPEIHKINKYSKASDIYAFGMLLLELHSKELPFGDKEWQHVVYFVVRDDLRPDIPNTCPKRLARLLQLCWKTDPKQRPDIETVLIHVEGLFQRYIKTDQRPQALCAFDHYVAVCMKHNVVVYDVQKEDISQPDYTIQSPDWVNHTPRDVTTVLDTLCVVVNSSCSRYLYQFPYRMSTRESRRIPIQECWTDAYCVTANDNILIVGTVSKELIVLQVPDFVRLKTIKLSHWLQGIHVGPHHLLLNDQDRLLVRHESNLNLDIAEVALPSGWYCRTAVFNPKDPDESHAPVIAVCGNYDANEGRINKFNWDGTKKTYVLSDYLADTLPDPAFRGMAITEDGCIAVSFDVDSIVRLYFND